MDSGEDFTTIAAKKSKISGKKLKISINTAQPNLRVNGHNYETLDENEHNTEPFDEALDRRIWSLADTRLQWQKRIAEKRRALPLEVEKTVLDLFNQQHGVDAEVSEAMQGEMADDLDSEDDTVPHIDEGFHKTIALVEELDQASQHTFPL
ncbi:hypothetical protein H0H92_013952 [Tricholoma furcatifolium]|nr:hypothetical protein H0H92_013952 [Tricholoma furcatifolium]